MYGSLKHFGDATSREARPLAVSVRTATDYQR